jgi:ABC-type lipoprotein export system ATPase subunit
VGVIGPNGVGKSTLFKMIVGKDDRDGRTLEIGETVKISYVDQNREGIDPNKTLWEVVSDGNDYMKVGDTEMPSRAYVAAFGFKGSDQQKPAGVLSGGERNRLNLALTLKQGGNLLLLDEPTNDLDTETSRAWKRRCCEFPGCAVITATTAGSWTASPRISWRGRAPTRTGGLVLVRGQLRGLPREAPGPGSGEAASRAPQADAPGRTGNPA